MSDQQHSDGPRGAPPPTALGAATTEPARINCEPSNGGRGLRLGSSGGASTSSSTSSRSDRPSASPSGRVGGGRSSRSESTPTYSGGEEELRRPISSHFSEFREKSVSFRRRGLKGEPPVRVDAEERHKAQSTQKSSHSFTPGVGAMHTHVRSTHASRHDLTGEEQRDHIRKYDVLARRYADGGGRRRSGGGTAWWGHFRP